MRQGLLAGMAVTAAAAATIAAQQPQIFRARVLTVPVFASVADRYGAFVLDLKQDDFEIRDNGKLQDITQFTAEVKPLSLLLLIDGSGSMLPTINSVVQAADSLVTRMLPEDRMGIASFADLFEMSQPFTSDRQALLDHLKNRFNPRFAGETRLWEALTESVMRLSNEPGRRVVLVLTDGKQWTYEQGSRGDESSATLSAAPKPLIALALERDVLIYAIAVWTKGSGAAETERPSSSIEALAAETGGGFVEMHENDQLQKLAGQITVELHRQYMLGFTPQTLDGTTHRLDVRVKRTGLTVTARRSYFAPRSDKMY